MLQINKLEKELEEKRRHINTLEIWLSSLDDLLKNKVSEIDYRLICNCGINNII